MALTTAAPELMTAEELDSVTEKFSLLSARVSVFVSTAKLSSWLP